MPPLAPYFYRCAKTGVLVYTSVHMCCPARDPEDHAPEESRVYAQDQVYGDYNQTQATTTTPAPVITESYSLGAMAQARPAGYTQAPVYADEVLGFPAEKVLYTATYGPCIANPFPATREGHEYHAPTRAGPGRAGPRAA
jgi:hypothetical protein